MNPFQSLLEERHSCRAFLSDPVPEATIQLIAETSQRTASWCNSQPWQALITSADETDRFREHLLARIQDTPGSYDIAPPGAYDGVYRERRRSAGYALYDSVGIEHSDTDGRVRQAMDNYRLFGAPHVAIITSEAGLGPYGYVDCGAYIATFLLAAHSVGVATIAQASVANFSNIVREHFAIPASRHVVCGISFGYADTEHPVNQFRTTRACLDESVSLIGF
jgi:nitroreductase